MKKAAILLLTLACIFTLVACQSGGQTENNAKPAYIVGRVVEVYEKGCLIEITDEGNYGKLAIGTPVSVRTDIDSCPVYAVGDHLRITFDGTVAESYPPQILHVSRIDKTDSHGNGI